jgi:hypothetical protein
VMQFSSMPIPISKGRPEAFLLDGPSMMRTSDKKNATRLIRRKG